MTRSLIFHEFRTAARESRWVLPIPSLALLLGLAIWHSLWLKHAAHPATAGFLTPTQRQAQELLQTVWPYAAWLVPYAILKFPDLKDPAAFWRATPTPAGAVFGARLLLGLLFTVLLPALVCGGTLAVIFPEVAAEQTVTVLLNQWTYFGIGAFAALVSRGHRGILVLGLMILTAVVTHQITGDLLRSFGPVQAQENPGLPYPFLRYGIPLLATSVLVILVRNPAKPCDIRSWLYGTTAVSAAGAIAAGYYAKHHPQEETLPTLHATLQPVSAEAALAEYRRLRQLNGASEVPAPRLIAVGEAPAGSAEFIPTYCDTSLFAKWHTETSAGQMAFGDDELRLDFAVRRRANPDAARSGPTNIGISFNDDRLTAKDLGELLPISDVQMTRKTDPHTMNCEWVPRAEVDRAAVLEFSTHLPDSHQTKPALQGQKLQITTRITGIKPAKPIIRFRCPATGGGTYRTTRYALHLAPARGEGHIDPMNGEGTTQVALDFNVLARRAPILATFTDSDPRDDFHETHAAIIYNAARRQVIPIGLYGHRTVSHNHNDTFLRATPTAGVEYYKGIIQEQLPRDSAINSLHYASETTLRKIPEDWLRESEIIVFSREKSRPVVLPVELSLSLPKPQRP